MLNIHFKEFRLQYIIKFIMLSDRRRMQAHMAPLCLNPWIMEAWMQAMTMYSACT